jgi:hypothetical protein
MRLTAFVLAALVACTHAVSAQPPQQGDVLHIDGSKNPEMIPQWAIWEQFFRHTVVKANPEHALSFLSPDEIAIIVSAANDHRKVMNDCETRALKMFEQIRNEPAPLINQKTQDVNLECRRQTLRIRDRTIERLRPEAQHALRQHIEAFKATMKVMVPKAEFEFFLRPE